MGTFHELKYFLSKKKNKKILPIQMNEVDDIVEALKDVEEKSQIAVSFTEDIYYLRRESKTVNMIVDEILQSETSSGYQAGNLEEPLQQAPVCGLFSWISDPFGVEAERKRKENEHKREREAERKSNEEKRKREAERK